MEPMSVPDQALLRLQAATSAFVSHTCRGQADYPFHLQPMSVPDQAPLGQADMMMLHHPTTPCYRGPVTALHVY